MDENTHRPLRTLRYSSNKRVLVDLCLEHIDFGRRPANESAVRVLRPWMRLTVTCAPRKSLSGEERQNAIMACVAVNGSCRGLVVNGLVLDSADVACVVRVRPLQEVVCSEHRCDREKYDSKTVANVPRGRRGRVAGILNTQ